MPPIGMDCALPSQLSESFNAAHRALVFPIVSSIGAVPT
jgi:hypothetical protein